MVAPVDPLEVTELVAITCADEFTTPPKDLTKQWVYEVETLSTSSASCAGGTANLTLPSIAGVNLPFMRWPETMRGVDTTNVPQPGLTIADKMLGDMFQTDTSQSRGSSSNVITQSTGELLTSAQETEYVEPASMQAMAPGDDMYPMVVAYVSYIPDQYLWFPELGGTGDPLRPAVAFGGDNRPWYDVNGSNRTSLQSTAFFGSSAGVTTARKVGTTHKYRCSIFLTNCVLTAQATESVNTLWTIAVAGPTRATIEQHVNSKNPLVPYAPAINGRAIWDLKRGGSSLSAVHDLMPRHQFWYGNLNADAYLLAQNDQYLLPCLFGEQPGCTARFNLQF